MMYQHIVDRMNSFIMVFLILLLVSSAVHAGDLTIPYSFSPGDIVSADTMNANFSAIETAVTDNHDRISAMENRTISFPAAALSHPDLATITQHVFGLLWQHQFQNPATIMIMSPTDYADGDVTFHIIFQTTTDTQGIVDFFLRPTSFSAGDDPPGSVDTLMGTSVAVAGKGFYQQSFTIPAVRMTEDWWFVSMQRIGLESTYGDDVIVQSVAFEYRTVR